MADLVNFSTVARRRVEQEPRDLKNGSLHTCTSPLRSPATLRFTLLIRGIFLDTVGEAVTEIGGVRSLETAHH